MLGIIPSKVSMVGDWWVAPTVTSGAALPANATWSNSHCRNSVA